jgi:hypothetical protein
MKLAALWWLLVISTILITGLGGISGVTGIAVWPDGVSSVRSLKGFLVLREPL